MDASWGIYISTPQTEASATGVASNISSAPAYIGWRTKTYGPLEITVHSAATSIVAAMYVFSWNTCQTIAKPSTTKRSAMMTSGVGTVDHEKRWSNELSTNTPINEAPATS